MESNPKRTVWIDHLRAAVNVLVVVHHAAVSYGTFLPHMDKASSELLDILTLFNDAFFMSLLFLVSGLFVHRGMVRKGVKKFLLDRLIRLGIPFLLLVVLIIPPGNFPDALAKGGSSFWSFMRTYTWSPGPLWFLWVLLVFNVIAVIIFRLRPRSFIVAADRFLSLAGKPGLFLVAAFLVAALAYAPLTLTGISWNGPGPFVMETNRFLLYALFFFTGVCLGSVDWEPRLFINGRLLGWKWGYWLMACMVGFFLYLLAGAIFKGGIVLHLGFAASCLASSCFLLALFKRWGDRPVKAWNSLSANAYGIYLFHIFFVNWSQYFLLEAALPAEVKFGIVFIVALLLSWLLTALLRKSRLVRQVL